MQNTPQGIGTRFWHRIRDPRVLEVICLWGMIAGAGIYLANAMAMGL